MKEKWNSVRILYFLGVICMIFLVDSGERFSDDEVAAQERNFSLSESSSEESEEEEDEEEEQDDRPAKTLQPKAK